MDCNRFRDELDDFVNGRLDPDTARALEAHRAECAACAALARRHGRPPRLVALGFVAAFGASILTLIYTGLNVRDADSVDDAAPASAEPAAPAGPGASEASDEGDTRAGPEAAETEARDAPERAGD